MKLRYQLLLLITGIVALAMALLVFGLSRSLQSGFTHYLEQLGERQIVEVVRELEAHFRKEGSWQAFVGRDDRLLELMVGTVSTNGITPPMPTQGLPHLLPGLPFVLLDDHALVVAGNAFLSADSRKIDLMLDGKKRGELRFAKPPQIVSPLERQFLREQSQRALMILIGIFLGSAIMAWYSIRLFLAPIEQLIQGAKRLAAGNYQIHLAPRPDELGSLALEFNRLAEALAHSQRARHQWVADISHELRTPITLIQGELQAIIDGVRPLDVELTKTLLQDSNHLAALVEDLYQLSLSDAGALDYQFERVDLRHLLEEAGADVRERLLQQGIELQLEIGESSCFMRGDYRRLSQLLSNLFTNALRYTDSPGLVRVHLQATKSHLLVRIEDSPPGVPVASYEKLFDRLYRVDASRSRAAGGAGLGLSIARSIVDAHEGRIHAQSSELGGLCVCMEFAKVSA